MDLREAIAPYREPNGMVSLYKNPGPHSTDNGLLFSATYLVLMGAKLTIDELDWFKNTVRSCSLKPGLLCRYPGEKEATAHDDLTGVAVASFLCGLRPLASQIYSYGDSHEYFWSTVPEPWRNDPASFQARIVDFVPTLRACSGLPLAWYDQTLTILGFLNNAWRDEDETSGKCLLYLKAKALYGRYFWVDYAINTWRSYMQRKYPGGVRALYATYFGKDHPFAIFAPEDFQ